MLQTSDKPETDARDLADDDALPLEEFRHRLYRIASDARLVLLAARAINNDDGAGDVECCDADAAYAIDRAAERIEERLLALAGGASLDAFRKAVES